LNKLFLLLQSNLRSALKLLVYRRRWACRYMRMWPMTYLTSDRWY
jgi:hypothetical protein